MNIIENYFLLHFKSIGQPNKINENLVFLKFDVLFSNIHKYFYQSYFVILNECCSMFYHFPTGCHQFNVTRSLILLLVYCWHIWSKLYMMYPEVSEERKKQNQTQRQNKVKRNKKLHRILNAMGCVPGAHCVCVCLSKLVSQYKINSVTEDGMKRERDKYKTGINIEMRLAILNSSINHFSLSLCDLFAQIKHHIHSGLNYFPPRVYQVLFLRYMSWMFLY